MKNKSNLVIVVPLYRDYLTLTERASLNTLFAGNQLTQYLITFIMPESLSKRFYSTEAAADLDRIAESNSNQSYFIVHAPDEYFSGIKGYSHLCVSHEFYSTFKNYDWILIFHTDALVLQSLENIEYWISLGYSYIGAPIVGVGSMWSHVPCVGNGGVSLRKVSDFLQCTDPEGLLQKRFGDKLRNEPIPTNSSVKYIDCEDMFWCELVKSLWVPFTVCDWIHAAAFSWDMNPDALCKMMDGKLPMFCHAWDKNFAFWNSKIHFDEETAKEIENTNRLGWESLNKKGEV